jgi:uncharacterized OB-fold protein
MSREVNVVAAWRGRATALTRQGWACSACGRLSLARRRICAACGQLAGATVAALPRHGTVAALCPAGGAVEHLDQVTGHKAAVLVELDGGARLACLLAHADSVSLHARLRGEQVRLAVRRIPLATGAAEPLHYGLKAAVDLATRVRLVAAAAASAANKEK